jgi:hypothetical protein
MPNLHGLDDERMRQTISDWARQVPIGMIGCIVRDTTTRSITNAADNLINWRTTDYESDSFFNYNAGSSDANTMEIPKGLGGLYAFNLAWSNQFISSRLITALIFKVRVTDNATGTQTMLYYNNMGGTYTVGTYINCAGTLPRILRPKDKIEFFVNPTTGFAETNTFVTPQAGFPGSPSICFYRLNPADPTG